MKRIIIGMIMVGAGSTLSFAQYEKAPPCTLLNPDLMKELKSGMVNNFSLSNASSYGMMATSTLQASGKNPHQPDVVSGKDQTEDEKQIAEIEAYNASEDWACQYAAQNLSDGLSTTAWVEGVEGDGIGEGVVSGQLDIKKPVKIWIGYGKSEALFKANNRPEKVRIFLLATNCPRPTQSTTIYDSLIIIGTAETILKDVNAYQNLLLPKITKPWKPKPCEFDEDNPGTYFIAVEILSVYKGLRYHDTCISEITN